MLSNDSTFTLPNRFSVSHIVSSPILNSSAITGYRIGRAYLSLGIDDFVLYRSNLSPSMRLINGLNRLLMFGLPHVQANSENPPLLAGLAAELPVGRYLQKVSNYPVNPGHLMITIRNPLALSAVERSAMMEQICQRNYVLYQYDESNRAFQNGYQEICRQLGIQNPVANPASDEKGVTTIEVVNETSKTASRYIPFSNQALNWHTDGYYNDEEHTIRAFVLHCRQSAASGGVTSLLDHELIFALLYQQNPKWIEALAQKDVLTIPANIQNGRNLRAAFSGPVFERDPVTAQLIMRYTERKRNIVWQNDPLVQAALDAIKALLRDQSNWVTRLTLQPGQGVIANNVLHHRSVFSNQSESITQIRKLERIRFSTRVDSTENLETMPK